VVPTSYGSSTHRCDLGNNGPGDGVQHGCRSRNRSSSESPHCITGQCTDSQGLAVALVAGLGAQVVLGSIAHWYNGKGNKPVNSSGRGTFHFAHIGLGLAVILVGWATALTGEHDTATKDDVLTSRIPPTMVRGIWSRDGPVYHGLESDLWRVHRGM
jgi:hypothetical protein